MWAWWWLEQRVWRVGKWRAGEGCGGLGGGWPGGGATAKVMVAVARVVAGWVRAVVECGVATMGMVAVMVLRVDSCGENSDGG